MRVGHEREKETVKNEPVRVKEGMKAKEVVVDRTTTRGKIPRA